MSTATSQETYSSTVSFSVENAYLTNASPAYGEALQKSLLFYEAQRAGELPADKRIDWRDDATLNDGSDVNIDLSGGYFDAGDAVKLVFPMASALTMLTWGAIEYREEYAASGQLDEALEAVKWGTDFLLAAHQVNNLGTQSFWGQIGDIEDDHAQWAPPEEIDVFRPSYKIDRFHPGSDLAGEAAAAMAAASILFRPTDSQYADELLTNAIQLYSFADDADGIPNNGEKIRGRYSDNLWNPNGIPYENPNDIYNSFSYEDELAWGAAWLYKALADSGVSNPSYLNQARSTYTGLWNEGTQSWDGKAHGTAVLLAQMTNDTRYKNDVETWLNNWLPGGSISYTPGGLAWLNTQNLGQWGSLRYSANTAFLAGIYSDTVNAAGGQYANFAEQQINYILGDNPNNFSYLIGFGDAYPLQPHHRGAHGLSGWDNYFNTSEPNQNILYGALVGGPTANSDSAYTDLRTDFKGNEITLDYNAAFTGALARLYGIYGGEPLTDAQLDALPGISVGQGNTITGTAGNDFLVGTSGNDIIFGFGGNDTIQGFAGDDQLNGGDGDDLMGGNSGNDTLNGDAGNDTLNGVDGNDTLNGGAGNDRLDGGVGDDMLKGDEGDDFLFGRAGFNTLEGGNGNDTLVGGGSRDILLGGYGVDSLIGGDGNDQLDGGADNDRLNGGNGDDLLNGGAGNDIIQGLAGNDTMNGGDGDDLMGGNAGNDTLNGDAGNDTLNGIDGNDTLNGGAGNDRLDGGSGDDVLKGDEGDDILFGRSGFNQLEGGSGNDTLVGGGNRDVLLGGAGRDNLIGGEGNDQLDGGADNDRLDGGGGDDLLNGGDGDDIIQGLAGNDTLNGGDGNDLLGGNIGNDVLNGGNGNDTLNGIDGNDILTGGAGNDRLDGGNGADVLIGGTLGSSGSIAQIDVLFGRAGRDVYVVQDMYEGFGNSDYALIRGFSTADDTIELGNGSHFLAATSGALPRGTGIYSNGDLLAIIEGFSPSSLSINASYFAYNYT